MSWSRFCRNEVSTDANKLQMSWSRICRNEVSIDANTLQMSWSRFITWQMMMSWCLMSSDVMRHIRDKLWPMPKHGSINLYVHGNQKAR